MPRKKGWKTPDEIREKIQGSMLINRLCDHVESDKPEGTMSASQVNAAKILLNKVIPDLKSIEMATDPDNPFNITHTVIQRTIVDPRDTNS